MAPKTLPPGAAERLRAAVVAACVAALAFCVGDAIARQYPFGWRTRNVNDLGNQYVPYHVHLWDLLHGKADGGLLLNWQSGYGTSFLPDLGTYLTSPFALLVGVFPRDRIDLALYVITVLKTASAAAAMTCLLLALRPGRWWAAGLLGTSYALCGWTLMLASYNPMWLDGLIAFPLLCLVGEWARAGRRPIVSVLVVALCWTANFYSAYMATVGAGLVFIARLLTDTGSATRRKLSSAGRAAISLVLGIGLTAPLLLPIVEGAHLAYPLPVEEFEPTSWYDLLTRLLPGTYGFETPSTYIDTGALLLALVLPFHPAVPRRTRAVWTVLAVAVTGSLQWGPTHAFWHAFTSPNGSQYRQTFVLSGVLVIVAWLAVAHGLPGRRQVACGAGVMTALVGIGAIGAERGLAGVGAYPGAALGLVAVVGALLLLRRAERVRRTLPAAIGIGLLFTTQFAQSALSNAWTDGKREAAFDDYAVWGQRHQWQYETIAAADGWPAYRTEPGREQTVGNDPLVVGGQGAQYYSSHTPEVWTRTLTALGGGWTSRGRSLQNLDNPVTDVLFSVGARLHSPIDPHQRGAAPQTAPPTVTREQVPPLVTVHAPATAPYGRSPYRNQELLLGSRVYTTPGAFRLHDSQGRAVDSGPDGFRVTGSHGDWKSSMYKLEASCPAGDRIFLWSPNLMGNVHLTREQPVRFVGRAPSHRAPVQPLGTAPANGRFTAWVRVLEPGTLEADGIGCLDLRRLAAAERGLAAGAATRVDVTDDGISAQLPPGSRGFAVISTPSIKGWGCAADGASHRVESYLGLLSVPLDGRTTRVSCTFTPPGLRLGEAACGASLLGVAGLAAYEWWRRARRRSSGAGGTDDGGWNAGGSASGGSVSGGSVSGGSVSGAEDDATPRRAGALVEDRVV
ncbi:YfhO family protein [Streptomyces sp.]|uniref:YfhO family protein n=1 Tax=Streptomyces sp. TaxID=1931 RepID=UPI002F42EE19